MSSQEPRQFDSGLTPILWRCPGEDEDGQRCRSFQFGPDWLCPQHMERPVAERYVAVRALYEGVVVTDEDANGGPLVLDLRTVPAQVVLPNA